MHFQVFIPDVAQELPSQSSDPLVRVGLEDLAANFDATRELRGPSGEDGGRMYAWLNPNQPHILPADQLVWHPALPCDTLPAGRYQVGTLSRRPPHPGELQREFLFPGYPVTLGDGRQWTVPDPNRWPQTIRVAPDGSLKYEMVRDVGGYRLDAGFLAEVERGA